MVVVVEVRLLERAGELAAFEVFAADIVSQRLSPMVDSALVVEVKVPRVQLDYLMEFHQPYHNDADAQAWKLE